MNNNDDDDPYYYNLKLDIYYHRDYLQSQISKTIILLMITIRMNIMFDKSTNGQIIKKKKKISRDIIHYSTSTRYDSLKA